ncbi:ATP-binding protein [Novosphingobium album (ex Liu et al. 2023)]|uniref:histidine kinase n=1 Tax=Novosphingobium album (ex Liu et al. 2023) TaxID=3031130 RepID=A0ABT5WMI2_9SPHN|nr:ATP-binding protein [Novosphingobium album (ex Liu et al. 2023)]MDE8651259.1 ATP-binding protein [Novosphingobium album (ex Liu et al. 2023)]
MFSRLVHRNVALIVGVVLAGQVIAGLLVMALVVRPQVDRVASVTADTILALSQIMRDLPEDRRAVLIARIERSGELAIRRDAQAPLGGRRFPNFIERQFMRALSERLAGADRLQWRSDRGRRLWFRLDLGGEPYWVSVTPPTRRGALTSLVLAFFTAFVIAVICGLLLQRRLNAPLMRVARAVDSWGPDHAGPPLDTSGPEEVAAVAGAFNRMTDRLRRDEAERSLMLAGVSHDLRTPLTRLRLCLEMMDARDPELEATAARQVDRIEAMLEQFLDFARGFENELPAPIDMRALLRTVANDAAPAGAIAVDAPEGLVVSLRRDACARAVGNLVGNALKHGAPPVAIAARRAGAMLEIAVSDAGAGMDAQSAAGLLRPFARGDRARGGDGAGLGLAIADRVAAAHGGTLAFERRAGRFAAVLRLRPG